MKKTRLVTVTGSRTNTLWHMLNHYKNIVDEMYVVVYEWDGTNILSEVGRILENFPTAKIVKVERREKFNWEVVTQLYNEIKLMHPDDWWVVSDDDEFHIYPMPLPFMIEDCEENGWDIVRGGFIDRIGDNGTFPEIQPYKNIFQQFPLAGFFRYPLSAACPNKICVVKGYVEITNGQHYAKINGETLWGPQLDNKLIAPIDRYSTQVHHFKWDSTCVERIKAVADIKKDYAYSKEYLKMYQAIRSNNFEIDITNGEFMIENIGEGEYSQWKILFEKIVTI
jgi:hypothetical protein